MSDAQSPVRVEREGPLGILTVAHGPLNLFDDALKPALFAALDDVESDRPRALLFRAEGRAVSGGVDVNVFDRLGGSADAAHALWEELFALSHRLEDLPIPTVFAAHALTLTWAFELALACDLIVAAESARFGLVERVVGLTPAMGGTQRLAERAGPARARELVYTGALYPAHELHGWGVVNKVWADDEFEAKARALAEDLAGGPTIAHAATKSTVRTAMDRGVRAADEHVARVAADLFETEDLRGAVRSFLADGPGKATYEGR